MLRNVLVSQLHQQSNKFLRAKKTNVDTIMIIALLDVLVTKPVLQKLVLQQDIENPPEQVSNALSLHSFEETHHFIILQPVDHLTDNFMHLKKERKYLQKKLNSLKEFAISYRILCAIAIFKGGCCIVMCLQATLAIETAQGFSVFYKNLK